MVTYPAPTHIVRPLSPITELTTPASARSISLPVVEREYDYKDESPIVPRAQQQGWGEADEKDGDGDSVYSQGSTRTVIPDPPAPIVRPNTTQHNTSPLPSPPGNLRPFPTPAGGLPPPPRSGSLRGFPERATLPTSPGLAYLQETGSALASPIASHTPISPGHSTETKGDEEDVDRMSVASVSSAGVAGVGAGAKSTAPGPRSRPSNIVVPEQASSVDRQARDSANHHLSWMNTPVVASPPDTSTPRSASHVDPGQIQDQPKSADMQSRISATYHPSWANIPVIPSPHGSPLGSPAPRSASILGLGQQRPDPPIRIASAHPSLVNIPIMDSPVPSPRARPKSVHGSASRPADTPIQIASNHSLVNIPFLPSPAPVPTPPPRSEKRSPTSRRGIISEPNSPTRSRPSSPKSRPSTLKKRPISLQTSRPTSWHSQKTSDSTHSTIKAKKSAKGKRSSMIEEGGAYGGSSNDNHSDISAGAVRPGVGRRGSRISALLSIFSQTSTVTSPTNSTGGHSPSSPTGFPNLEEEITDDLKGDTPPLAVIRTSGTFGIQDDGSAHLLLIDEPTLPLTATPTSARLQRQRRDSDNGTVKSAPLGPALYMGNPDPRDSIDEDREDILARTVRSLTPFEIENPTSPLESVLNSVSPLETASYETRSVEGPHSLLVIPGRSDVSERASSTSTGRTEDSHTRIDQGIQLSEAAQMVDHWTQTSPASSIAPSSRSKRPLPKPPSTASHTHHDVLEHGPTSTSTHHASSYGQRRPVSLPPPPPPSAYPQPAPPPPLPTSDLPLLIASHLLSNHATALMRHSAGLAEGAEMMKRMADESMQWGSILLNMASGQQAGSQAGSGFTMPGKTWSTDVQPTDPGIPHHGSLGTGNVPLYDGLPPTNTVDPTYTPRPIFQTPPSPSTPALRDGNQNRAKDDRYTPIPPRMTSRRSRSRLDLTSYTGFYDEVENLGRKGWDDIHQAEEIWIKGMNDLKDFLNAGPDQESRRTSREPEQTPSSITYAPIAERHYPVSCSHPHDHSNVSPKRTSRGGVTSILRTDESFLPSPTDLLPSSIGTETGDSHLPSFNLMTPPDDTTLRARSAPHAFGRQPISAERVKSQVAEIYNLESMPNTASTGVGYDSPQFKPHPAAYPILRPSSPSQPKSFAVDRSKTEKDKEKHRPPPFNLDTEVPTYAHEKLGTASTLSQPSTGTGTIRRTRSGRKLKKRSSAVPLQLAMIPPSPGKRDQQPDTAGSTIKSSKGKRHWWSRKKEGTGSTADSDWRGSITAV